MSKETKNRGKLFIFLTSIISIFLLLVSLEVSVRLVYYQINSPYIFGLHHLYARKLAPFFETASVPVGVELNTKAWEASFTERNLPVPSSGPREGYWGVRIRPKNYDNCGYLRYCEAERNIPHQIAFDNQGLQHAGSLDQSDIHILIIGGSVAAGAYASSIENTYFHILQRLLSKNSVNAYVSVLAAGGWVSSDEVAALADRGLQLDPDIVIFLDGLNDLIVMEFPVSSMRLEQRVAYYLRNMMIAGELVKGHGATVVYALQPTLPSKKHKSDLEELILKTTFLRTVRPGEVPMSAHPDYEHMRQGLRQLTQDNGGQFVDLSGIFDDEMHTTFADAFHFSDPGHEILAETLAKEILHVLKSNM